MITAGDVEQATVCTTTT